MNLQEFLIDSWGKCPAYNASVYLQISRVCPLASEIYEFLAEVSPLPIGFFCGEYRKRECPLADGMISAALEKTN